MYHFVNNICPHFVKIFLVFYYKLVDQKYTTTSIFRVFWYNLDIIVNIMW